jgi:hypothetical protein
MKVKGLNRACSKVGNVLGDPATTNLRRKFISNDILSTPFRGYIYRMSPEMHSKMYWSKWGLLGFLEIMPRILTSRASICWYVGVRVWRAVKITRIVPVILLVSTYTNIKCQSLTPHEMVIFGELFRSLPNLYLSQERVYQICRIIMYINLRETNLPLMSSDKGIDNCTHMSWPFCLIISIRSMAMAAYV